MKKEDLIRALTAQCADLPKETVERLSKKIFSILIDTIRDGGRAEIRGFGTFFSRERKGRLLRNPRTGNLVEVAAKRIPRFKAGVVLKKKIDERGRRKDP